MCFITTGDENQTQAIEEPPPPPMKPQVPLGFLTIILILCFCQFNSKLHYFNMHRKSPTPTPHFFSYTPQFLVKM